MRIPRWYTVIFLRKQNWRYTEELNTNHVKLVQSAKASDSLPVFHDKQTKASANKVSSSAMTDWATSITNLHLLWGIFITSGRLTVLLCWIAVACQLLNTHIYTHKHAQIVKYPPPQCTIGIWQTTPQQRWTNIQLFTHRWDNLICRAESRVCPTLKIFNSSGQSPTQSTCSLNHICPLTQNIHSKTFTLKSTHTVG